MLYSLPFWFGITYNYVNTEFYGKDQASINMTVHYTMVFNTFVLMNLFNQIACRKLGWKEWNFVDNFFNNLYFFIVVIGEFALQWFIVEIGSDAFRTTPLTLVQHITCYSFGIGALLVAIGGKFIPEKFAPKFALALNEADNEDGNDVFTRMTNKFTKPAQKSETQRLLDSN